MTLNNYLKHSDIARQTISSILYGIVTILLLLISCSPLPMIQSARVTGKFGLGMNLPSTVIKSKTYDIDYGKGFDGFFRWGILDRVEIRAFSLLAVLPRAQCGSVKIALFDVGNKQLFRNISAAVFCGGILEKRDIGESRAYNGGLIIGTHCPVWHSDFELVFISSGSKEITKNGCYDNQCMEESVIKSANLSLGCILRPTKWRFMEINAGITGIIPVTKEVEISPLISQFGMSVYLPGKRSKKSD
ncbi:MAG TPA: hypothetical protein VHP36_08955 [Chitinispirillaceae bacterium]|nr:hypothetical protein [Chitinispirillaceae bacterium]